MKSLRELTELRVFLFRHGVTQQELADSIHLSRVTISKVIGGEVEPRLSTINAILEFCLAIDPTVTFEHLFDYPKKKAA